MIQNNNAVHFLKHRDMLQSMIDATGEIDDNGSRESSRGCLARAQRMTERLTDEQVVGEAIGFLLAGYETTANTLAYTSYLLALNPDIQERLQSEIDSYFEDKPVIMYFLHGEPVLLYCTL